MTEQKSAKGAMPHAALQTKSAINEFLRDFREFQKDVKSRLSENSDRIDALGRKSLASRPALSRAADVAAPHEKAFAAYVRSGDDDALRGLYLDEKALNTAVAADGGYLVDPQTADQIATILKGASSIRSVAKTVQVESGSYDVLIDKADFGADWVGELATQSETTTPQIERISVILHELSAMPKASQRLLDDSAFNVEEWLAERIADQFGHTESAAFVNGDGVDKPKGFLAYPIVANDAATWGELGYVATGAVGDFSATDPADAVVDLVYSLGARYRANGTFIMNSKTAGAVRKMKDADGRFLWTEGISEGQPARLMGYPVVICEDMPDIAADAAAIAFGDFSAGYTIAERPDLRVLRDPFSAKPNVLFYASKRVGGDVTDFSAIKLLKFAAS